MKDAAAICVLSEKSGNDILLITRSDGRGVVHEVHWPLGDLEKLGYMGACDRVGNAILRMLATPCEKKFQCYPLLIPPKPLSHDPYFMVVKLIQLSIRHRTKAYISAIDDLIDRFSTEISGTNLADSWPESRAAISLYED